MQTFFRCEEELEEDVAQVLEAACKKRVTDMHHDVKHQAVITYHASVLGTRMEKEEARRTMLTRDQFLSVDEQH